MNGLVDGYFSPGKLLFDTFFEFFPFFVELLGELDNLFFISVVERAVFDDLLDVFFDALHTCIFAQSEFMGNC